MGEDKEFFLLGSEWGICYDRVIKIGPKKNSIKTFYKAMCNWFIEDEGRSTSKITYATHFPSQNKGDDLFFFYWVSQINDTNDKRILYTYCDRKGNIIKTAAFYPSEYDEESGIPFTYRACPIPTKYNHTDNAPQKIGSNAVALLVYRSTGKYIYYILSPNSERIVEIHANTALYFLPTLLDGGKTLFAVSQDEWKGYDAPLPALPYHDMLNWERDHSITTGSYGYFIHLPLNIENQ